MRNYTGGRCLRSNIALAAGLLPFATGLAWDRLVAPVRSTADQVTAPATATGERTQGSPGRTEAPAKSIESIEAPRSANRPKTTQAFELKITETDRPWTLPLGDAQSGWLVAVGMTNRDDARQRLRIRVRAKQAIDSGDGIVPHIGLMKSGDIGSTDRHVVARHRNPIRPDRPTEPPATRRFAIQTFSGDSTDPAFYESVDSHLARLGSRVAIYVDDRDRKDVTSATLESIVEAMDQLIPERVVARIGDAADTDGDGRMTILISQVLNRMAEGTAVLDGFVRASDFDRTGRMPRSHSCDMIYLNSRVQAGPFLKSLLAHEFTHAVIASARAAGSQGADSVETEDSWLDEGLAHLSERWVDDNWENLDYRIAEFLAEPGEHRLVVNDRIGIAHGRAHGHRGASFLFLDWCRSEFGDDLPARLVSSRKTGVANLEEATGKPFDALFRAWTVALLNQAACEGDVESLRAKALCDDWLVGVPRSNELTIEQNGPPAVAEWTAEGTSVRLFRIVPADPKDRPEGFEVSLDTTTPENVQVSVLPLEAPHRGFALEVIALGGSDSGGRSKIRLRVTNRDDSRVLKIQAAAWESILPGLDARELRRRRGFFDVLALSRTLGSMTIRPGQSLISAPIEVDFAVDSYEPMRWKAVAHDDAGRPVFAWADQVTGVRYAPRSLERIATDIAPDRTGTLRR